MSSVSSTNLLSGGCPIKHDQKISNSTNNNTNLLTGGCPHQHGIKTKDDTVLHTINNIPVPNGIIY